MTSAFRISFFTLAAILVGVAASAPSSIAHAQEFRVDSKVFQGEEEKPMAESLTLFYEGMVYDFLNSGTREVTIFDLPRGRIVLMDPANKIRTEIDTKSLAQFIEEMRPRALQPKSPALVKFCADPKFEESTDKSGWMVFASSHMTYRVKPLSGQSATDTKAYCEFCDWGTKVNTVMHPGGLPPFPRIAVDAALARAGCLPEQVERVMPAKGLFGKPTVVRSEHVFASGLLTEDKKKIDEAGEYLVTLRQISFNEYLQAAQPQEKK